MNSGTESFGFRFVDENGNEIPLRISSADRKIIKAGVIHGGVIHGEEGTATPVYRLEKPKTIPNSERAFFLSYNSTVPLECELSFSSGFVRTFPLPPASEGAIEYRMPLPPDDSLTGFRLVSLHPEPAEAGFRVIEAGFAPKYNGISFIPDPGMGGGTVTARLQGHGIEYCPDLKEYFFSGILDSFRMTGRDYKNTHVMLGYWYGGESFGGENFSSGGTFEPAGKIFLTFSSGNETRRLSVTLRKGRHTVHFYDSFLGFIPRSMKFEEDRGTLPEGFSVVSLEILSVSAGGPGGETGAHPFDPLPADLGMILNFGMESWRNQNWELFSWNLIPDILVMDTADYSLLYRFFSRLAFFVEKKGYAGRIIGNEELDTLRSWNAHDYRAEDLSRFFLKARNENFILNPEEEILRDILIHNRIIGNSDEDFRPGKGGIIAVSRESLLYLRHLFMAHEGFHGFFFTSEQYRMKIGEIWESLSSDERRFWEIFLGWMDYNIEDQYLVQNEFQAYLLQQPLINVNAYFLNIIIPRLKRNLPRRSRELDHFAAAFPDHFFLSASLANDAVYSVFGVRGGDLLCVRNAR